MEDEYQINYKHPDWKYWGQLDTFEAYSDAEQEFNRLTNNKDSFGIYQLIRVHYEIVKEKEVNKK